MDPLMNSAVWPPPPPSFPTQPPFFPPPTPQIPTGNNNNFSPQSEPPYPDMIIAAISALKEREGSSRQAIDRHIQSVYTGNLPSNHPTLLTWHLKKMKNDGSLSMVKHSYALPGTVPIPDPSPLSSVPASGPKRGRGRPPKSTTPAQLRPSEPNAVPFSDTSAQPNAETMFVSLGLVDGPPGGGEGSVKRGRGRPRLGPKTGAETGPKPVKEKKARGRPARIDRGAGRPPKVAEPQIVAAAGQRKGRGRPPKKVVLPGGKPRGRPRKFPVSLVAGGAPVVGVKRGRGRPPNAGQQAKKPRRVSGKPLGRPRKDASAPATQGAAQHLVAYQNLANKLMHFQSRVKQAVDLVRPYFTSETTPYVYGALQELEELAEMDMTAPPQAPPQQPPVAQS